MDPRETGDPGVPGARARRVKESPMRQLKSAACLFALAATAPVWAASWEIDPAHSTASFKVRHLAVSNVSGGFGKVTGSVKWDEAEPTLASVEAEIGRA